MVLYVFNSIRARPYVYDESNFILGLKSDERTDESPLRVNKTDMT